MKPVKLILLTLAIMAQLSVCGKIVQTYHVTRPGSLSEMMGESRLCIDSLVVIGEVDADDVATMRSCVYDGITSGLNLLDAVFPDNALPDDAFASGFVINEGEVGYDNSLQYVTLPRSLRSIGNNAFTNCGLRQIDLPETLERIGAYAFAGCCWLTGCVTVPAGVTELVGTFERCERVAVVEILAPTCNFSGTFNDMFSLRRIAFPSTWNLTGNATFRNCRSLEGVLEYKTTATSAQIPAENFMMCSSLTRIVLPEQLRACGQRAFDYCGMQEIVWPKSMPWGSAQLFSFRHGKFTRFFAHRFMRSISLENFAGNEQLEALGIDAHITLQGDALSGCRLLRSVYCVGATPPAVTGGEPFPDKPADAVLYVPMGAKPAYETAEYWNSFGQIVETEVFPEWITSQSLTSSQP